jgi:hypothetical protein
MNGGTISHSNDRDGCGKTLIVESNPSGHHLEYVDYLVRYLGECGSDTTVLTSAEGAASSIVQSWDKSTHSSPSVVAYQRGDPVFTSIRRIREFAKASGSHRVILPNGDRLVYQLGLRGGWPRDLELRALLMRSPWISPRRASRDAAKKYLAQRATRHENVTLLHLAGPGDRHSAVAVVQDPARWTPVGVRPESLSRVQLDKNRFWFGVMGVIDVRKNIDLIAQSLTDVQPTRTGMLIAGLFQAHVLSEAMPHLRRYEERGGVVVLLDRLLTEEELDSLVTEVDCVVCAHSNEGPSGMLLKAAAAGQRSIAAGATTLKLDCAVVDGAEWVELQAPSLTKAMARAMLRPRPHPHTYGSPDVFARLLVGDELQA